MQRMDTKARALELLGGTEAQLGDLMQEAAKLRQYDQIPAIADMAKALAELRSKFSNDLSSGQDSFRSQETPLRASSHKEADQSTSELGYPRFEREEDRLIKVGWSSSNNRAYEHRVTRDIVEEICRHIASRGQGKKPFKMDKLFPLKLDNGDLIPTYQAYLVLKWLLGNDVVERRGNDGYVVVDRSFGEETISQIWKKTPLRSAHP